MQNLIRYSVIEQKNKREFLLLIGSGCKWKKCSFCDYHTDFNKNPEACFKINEKELNKVTGKYNVLEIVNSGSFVDLDEKTMQKIEDVCINKNINTLHFECHWAHKDNIEKLKKHFKSLGITVKTKIGIETFDYYYRESFLNKGIEEKDVNIIKKYFDEVCLLQGLAGQSVDFILKDIAIGLENFERICINIMVENKTKIKPDPNTIQNFIKYIYPIYKNNNRVDILLNNTDFGVGGIKND
nr:radical SAM protein [uncultured Tyzzerella sp.]